jgi:6-phosphogluconolactonase
VISTDEMNLPRKNDGKSRRFLKPLVALIVLGLLPARAADYFTYFGTQRSGTNIGLSIAHFDTDSGVLTKPELAIQAAAPAFFTIAPDGRHLYTCNAANPGGVSAYEIEPHTGALKFLNRVSSGGSGPCYVSLDQTARFAFVANYSSGNIAVFAIKPDGSLGERTAFVQHAGSSINPQRQTHPYAHSIIVDPSNRFALVADLGVDKIFIYRFNEKDGSLKTNNPPFATIAPGSGPRHVKFHPNGRWFYLINEIASTIVGFKWDSATGSLAEFQTISALPDDFKGTNTSAEIEVHPDGKFLYASNRGDDSITVFGIDQNTGKLNLVQRASCGGRTPRFFTFDPTGKWLLCSNHGSDNTVIFRVDEHTGKLTNAGDPVSVPYPFCERFLPAQ